VVTHNPTLIDLEGIKAVVRKVGFEPLEEGQSVETREEAHLRQVRQSWNRVLWSWILGMPVFVLMVIKWFSPGVSITGFDPWIMFLFTTPLIFWTGRKYFLGAYQAIRYARVATADVLIALGAGSAYLYNVVAPGGTHSWRERKEALETEGKTVMLVAVGESVKGLVAVADTVKPEAARVVAELKGLGMQVTMLTGDNRRTADAIARQVGIDRVIAEVLPHEKVDEIKRLQQGTVKRRTLFGTREERALVAMVGDGLNDAPALAQADIGVAIGTGTDVAAEASDVTLIRGDLLGVLRAIRLSRETFRIIRQNFLYAFGFNGLGLPFAAIGLLPPVVASAMMGISSLAVVGNSMRLKRF
jgi:cation transport ATPase